MKIEMLWIHTVFFLRKKLSTYKKCLMSFSHEGTKKGGNEENKKKQMNQSLSTFFLYDIFSAVILVLNQKRFSRKKIKMKKFFLSFFFCFIVK